jgi:hypothetical protein
MYTILNGKIICPEIFEEISSMVFTFNPRHNLIFKKSTYTQSYNLNVSKIRMIRVCNTEIFRIQLQHFTLNFY